MPVVVLRLQAMTGRPVSLFRGNFLYERIGGGNDGFYVILPFQELPAIGYEPVDTAVVVAVQTYEKMNVIGHNAVVRERNIAAVCTDAL